MVLVLGDMVPVWFPHILAISHRLAEFVRWIEPGRFGHLIWGENSHLQLLPPGRTCTRAVVLRNQAADLLQNQWMFCGNQDSWQKWKEIQGLFLHYYYTSEGNMIIFSTSKKSQNVQNRFMPKRDEKKKSLLLYVFIIYINTLFILLCF